MKPASRSSSYEVGWQVIAAAQVREELADLTLTLPAASACTAPSHARKSSVSFHQWTMPAGSLSLTRAENALPLDFRCISLVGTDSSPDISLADLSGG